MCVACQNLLQEKIIIYIFIILLTGAHINPAVTLAACVIRNISPMRAAMYITAQCGGGIAGAALLYG